MSKATKNIMVIVGILLFIGAVLSVVGAGAYSHFQPQLFGAATEFQLLFPTVDGPRVQGGYEESLKQYSESLHRPLTARVSLLHESSSDRYRIIALDRDPQTAANTVNFLTLSIMDTLQHSAGERRINVLVKGEPSLQPSYPSMPQIATIGFISGAIFATAGVAFFLIAFSRRSLGS